MIIEYSASKKPANKGWFWFDNKAKYCLSWAESVDDESAFLRFGYSKYLN